MSEVKSNYIVEDLGGGSQRITVTFDRQGREIGVVLRTSKKRGIVFQKVEAGGLGALNGIKEGIFFFFFFKIIIKIIKIFKII